MRRLFIQFYLLLIGCFTLAILLVGMVYQVTAERAGDRYLERMMQGSLGLLTGELARLPPEHWPARMAEQSRQLTLPLQIGALANQPLANEDQAFLEAGNIVIVEEDDTFLQRIPGTDQVLIVGPVPSPTCTSCTGSMWGCCWSSASRWGCRSCSGCARTGAACNSSNRPPAGSVTAISPVAPVCRPAACSRAYAPSTR